jgi:phosphonopyruvate decarboxylase
MINTKLFGEKLTGLGFTFFSGVPCSFLKDLINFAINDCQFVMSANEGDAVAICAGACIGGRKSVFLCQNSGLTNAVSPLTSLNYPFNIPVLGFVSLRGEDGLADEPQHELMGRITTDLLDVLQIKWDYLSPDLSEAKKQLEIADQYIENNKSFFFVVKKNTFENEGLKEQKPVIVSNSNKINKSKADHLPQRIEVLKILNSLKDDDSIILATTGKTGRELFTVEDAKNNLYMVGSMGCISSLALGLALVKPDKHIIAVDGDGSLLMRMGSLATNAYYNPKNMLHILLDNNSHDSTGGQFTVSNNINFVDLAASLAYKNSYYAHDLAEMETLIKNWKKNPGLTFIYIKIAKGSIEKLARPSLSPELTKERLLEFINGKI